MQWSTRLGETVGAVVVAAVLGAAALVVDPVGAVLVGGAALLLLAVAVRDVVRAPRLSADEAGVVVRTTAGTTTVPWARLRTRVRTTRRLGLRTTTLELEDTAEDTVLLVLGRRDLGTDPERVGAELLRLRPAGS
ncbi:PH domain-containing protein [Geodermatophilaceae bacterium NBWT11]|nr:PH domain-containing protein [Geodermatophilaceae bacterium NBWT11]